MSTRFLQALDIARVCSVPTRHIWYVFCNNICYNFCVCHVCAKCTTKLSNQTGETSGLNNNDCTAMCPMGTYGDVVGARTIDDCKKCPAGTFGMLPGLTTRRCSGVCPPGRYSKDEGLISLTACVRCPRAYYMWQCQEGQRQYTGKAVPARAHDSRGH